MEFELMDAAQYRAMSNEAFELRSKAVCEELANPESKVQIDDLEKEVGIIKEERSRRAMIDEIAIEERKAVTDGAGILLDTTEEKEERKAALPKKQDRATEALSSPEYERAFAHYLNTRGAKLEAEFEQYQKRTDDPGVLDDGGILIPLNIHQSIIEKMVDRGTIANQVTETNLPGGQDFPVADFSMEAHWIGETETSDYQSLDKVNDKVSFRYHQLEARTARTLLSATVLPSLFGDKFSEAAANAMLDAKEKAILHGSGSSQPLGLLVDPRLTNSVALASTDFTVKNYEKNVKNNIARLASGYRNGKLYMAETTFNYYFEGMTDSNGNPVARVNYGMDNEISRTLFGVRVECLDEKYLPYFDDAATNHDCFMFYGDLKNYVWNSNLQMRADRWEDYESNQFKTRLILIADGKPLDVHGFVKFTNGAPTKPSGGGQNPPQEQEG